MSTTGIATNTQVSAKVIVVRKGKRKRSNYTPLPDQVDLRIANSDEELSQSSQSDSGHSNHSRSAVALQSSAASTSAVTPTYRQQPYLSTSTSVGFSRATSADVPPAQKMPPTNTAPATTMQPDEEDDEDDDSFMTYEDSVKQKLSQTREQMKIVLQNFSEEQMHRYETFRRVGISRSFIKRVMHTVVDQSCNPNTIMLLGGVAKVFVGELVEEAKDVMHEWNESGPLQPSHLLEAHRRLRTRAQVLPPCSRLRKRRNWL